MKPDNFADAKCCGSLLAKPGYWAFVPNPLPPSVLGPDWRIVNQLAIAERESWLHLAGLAQKSPQSHSCLFLLF